MNLRTTAMATGLAALLGTGAAFAQSDAEYPAPSQQMSQQEHHHHGRHGVLALIREEVNAGRISHKEGMLLVEKISAMKAERRARREARYQGRQGSEGRGQAASYGQGNYPPPPAQQPNPQ
ncbi:MAG TPA: hypothetical protein VHT03_08050 [Rhizomicrobium sp.]|nr:hypothetical protein [Rhizomicrobium sp.]